MTQQQLQANPGYWSYYGSAPVVNAPYAFFRDAQGLHIGVKAPANGTWAGLYAESPNTSAMLFHSVLTVPQRTIPYQWYDTGLYVQTSQPFVNYVTCAVVIGAWGANWAVVSTTGDTNQATQFNLLWADNSPNQPLTRDCTIVTNGNNLLKVYLDGSLAYSNSTLNLQMPGPFNSYLEPQSSYPGQMLNSTYKDYYVTTSENVQVTNNPIIAATVKLVDSTGLVLASAPVNSSGTATLGIGHYHMPLGAYIKIYDALNNQIASTSGPVNIYGGDAFSVTSLSGTSAVPQAPTNLAASAVSSSQINLSWTAPSNDGGSAITGYKIDRSTDGGLTWSTITANTASTGTAYSDTGLTASTTYTYRVEAVNSAGTSSPSDTASATTQSGSTSVGSTTAATVYSGRATGLSVQTSVLSGTFADTGPLPPSGGEIETSAVSVQASQGQGDGLNSVTMGFNNTAQSQATYSDVTLLPGTSNPITADFIRSDSSTTCSGVAGSSEISNLKLAGQQINVTGAVNQTVSIPATLTLVLNEQISSSSAGSNNITVNAIDLRLASGDQVLVSSTSSGITCGTTPVTKQDFMTGGGFILVNNQHANFGFVAGYKPNQSTVSGQLNYVDHSTGMHVKSVDIRSYSGSGKTRTFSGDATINGLPGYTFTTNATDNGEPGKGNDYFSMTLSNGYSASGVLAGGNIKLHT